MTVMTGALYPQRPGALSRGAYSFRNGGWADLATALGMGILSADGQNVTLPQGIAAGLQNFQQTSRDRQQEQRQTWLDQMTQQQFDLTKSEAEARAQDRKDEKARKERLRALLMGGGPAIPIGEGGPAGGQFTAPQGPGLAPELGLPEVIAKALAEEGDPTVFATLFGQKATRDAQAKRDAEGMAWDREKFDKQYALDVKQLGVSAANAAASRRIQEAELALKQRELEGRGGVGDLFGKGDEANVILAYGPKIRAGTATPDEIDAYNLAVAAFQKAIPIAIPDPNNPGAMMQGIYRPELPQGFPAPGSAGGSMQGATPSDGQSGGITRIEGSSKPPSSEQARMVAVTDSALAASQKVRGLIFDKDGKLRRDLLALKALPWQGLSSEAKQLSTYYYALADADIRLRTGTAAPASEIEAHARAMMPDVTDSEQSALTKIEAVESIAAAVNRQFKPPKADQPASNARPSADDLAEKWGIK